MVQDVLLYFGKFPIRYLGILLSDLRYFYFTIYKYESLSKEGWFVKGTDYRSIVKHETGHVVANIYGINGMEIAMDITGNSRKEVMRYISSNLSEYAGAFKDGSEIISEVFSDVFGSDNPSEFSLRFIEECDKIREKRM